MSRPIKFRFWDKEHRFMWRTGMEGESIFLQDGEYRFYNRHIYKELLSKGQAKVEDFQFQTHFDEKTGCLNGYVYGPAFEVTDDPFPMYENETWELEPSEFTGLKDKNGVEIYENDIIGVELGDQYYFAIVKRGGWYWYGDMVFANDIIDFDDIGDENDMSADCDVLGNIFQNPKLLEENK